MYTVIMDEPLTHVCLATAEAPNSTRSGNSRRPTGTSHDAAGEARGGSRRHGCAALTQYGPFRTIQARRSARYWAAPRPEGKGLPRLGGQAIGLLNGFAAEFRGAQRIAIRPTRRPSTILTGPSRIPEPSGYRRRPPQRPGRRPGRGGSVQLTQRELEARPF